MRRIPIAILLVATTFGGITAAAEAHAQDPDPGMPMSADSLDGGSDAGPASTGDRAADQMQPSYGESAEAQASPDRSAPPRSLRAYWHVFIAFALIWLLLFGYALTIGRRLKNVEEEVRGLRRS